MYKKLLIASNNSHKVSEIKGVLKDLDIEILSMKDVNLSIEVTEDGETLEENSFKKASEISRAASLPVIADDTGLFVEALNGRPGVYSARYAGENATYDENCIKLLNELKNFPEEERSAEFKSVICLMDEKGDSKMFEGICRGKIINEPKGKNGFGYDPLFIPEGFDKTFAELTPDEKNSISHRAKALMRLKTFLST